MVRVHERECWPLCGMASRNRRELFSAYEAYSVKMWALLEQTIGNLLQLIRLIALDTAQTNYLVIAQPSNPDKKEARFGLCKLLVSVGFQLLVNALDHFIRQPTSHRYQNRCTLLRDMKESHRILCASLLFNSLVRPALHLGAGKLP